jgi:hypothetical protein
MDRTVFAKVTPIVRTSFLLFWLMMFILALFSCEHDKQLNATPKFTFSAENERERNELRKELVDLQKDIDREIDKVNEKLAASSDLSRENLLYADRKLKSNRSKLDKALLDINNCNEGDWDAVKRATHATALEIKSSYNQVAYKYDDLFGNR